MPPDADERHRQASEVRLPSRLSSINSDKLTSPLPERKASRWSRTNGRASIHLGGIGQKRFVVPKEFDMPETLLWGERGLVTTFVLDLNADRTLGRWRQFLHAVRFGPNGVPPNGLDWRNVVSVWAVVEPGFGSRGFGSPDLVARLDFNNQQQFSVVLMLEAKTGTYAQTTLDPTCSRKAKKFNSTLNGQIELNHRLTLALEAYHDDGLLLIEPEWVADTPYRDTGVPRLVRKLAVLRQLVPHLRQGNRRQYLHIAITSDVTNPLITGLGGYLPQVFDQRGNDCWNRQNLKYGWIGWNRLKELAEENWGQASVFLPSYHLNQPYLAGEEAPVPENVVAAAWPANRCQSGVSVVRLRGYTPDTQNTAVHFSWSGNSCAIRNYLNPGIHANPQDPAYVQTLLVLPLIQPQRERRFSRIRPRCNNLGAWQAIITDTNIAWHLPNAAVGGDAGPYLTA